MARHRYDSPQYTIERILVFPGIADCSDAAGNSGQMTMPDPIEVQEFGVVITETITLVSLCTVELREGGTVLATISLPSGSAVGTLITTRTVTAGAFATVGDLLFYHNVTTAGIGECTGYVKYYAKPS